MLGILKGSRGTILDRKIEARKLRVFMLHVYLAVYGSVSEANPAVPIGAEAEQDLTAVEVEEGYPWTFDSDLDQALQLSLVETGISSASHSSDQQPRTCTGDLNFFALQMETLPFSQASIAPMDLSKSSNVSEDNKDEENRSSNNGVDGGPSSGKRKTQDEGDVEDLGSNIPTVVCPPCVAYPRKKKKDAFTATSAACPSSSKTQDESNVEDLGSNNPTTVCPPCVAYPRKKKKDAFAATCAACPPSSKNKKKKSQKKDVSSDEEDSVTSFGSSVSSQKEDEDLDLLTIGLEADMKWKTLEDVEMERIESLAQSLREDPLCPPPLNFGAELLKQEGLNLPLVHCAFKGCSWISESRPCLRTSTGAKALPIVTQQGLWTTIACRKQREDSIYGCCGEKTCLKQHIVDEHIDSLIESCGLEQQALL